MYTEKEAFERFCPIWSNDNYNIRCISSKCMMWRWYSQSEIDKPPKGYCGLAGKPELSIFYSKQV